MQPHKIWNQLVRETGADLPYKSVSELKRVHLQRGGSLSDSIYQAALQQLRADRPQAIDLWAPWAPEQIAQRQALSLPTLQPAQGEANDPISDSRPPAGKVPL